MFKYILFFVFVLCLSNNVLANPVFSNAEIDYVFGGYPDGTVAFVPIGEVVNPANCTKTDAYTVPPDHDTKAAMSILLAAKMSNKRVYFSVRSDVCHTLTQTDNPSTFTYPVIQRVAIK